MKELKPTCAPNGVYSVKRTCAELGISHKESQAAKLLTEGCNMGIETISGSLNEYRDADSKSVAIAERLRTLEEKMVGDLQPLL